MTMYSVMTVACFSKDAVEAHGEDFRVRFSERGAFEPGPERPDGVYHWIPVTMELEEQTVAGAAMEAINRLEQDAHEPRLAPSDAGDAEEKPADEAQRGPRNSFKA